MYATLADLLALQPEDVILQLADDVEGGINNRSRRRTGSAMRNVDAAINSACVIIDYYIGGKYSVPLGKPFPPLIIDIAAHLALCNLYDRRRELDVPDGIKERRERYMALLKEIRDGDAGLPEVEDGASGGGGGVKFYTPRKEFSRSLLARM